MPSQDTTQIKEKILQTLRLRGPSLPVHFAKEINQSMLFTSAFLSELLSEKKLKTSHMRVGSSPIYFLQEQKAGLEKYATHLKSKEKDAFDLLQEKKFLKDSEQNPPIQVALRAIKDFAIPFTSQEELYWKYFIADMDDFKETPKKQELKSETKEEEIQKQPEEKIMTSIEKEKETETSTTKIEEIFDKPEKPIPYRTHQKLELKEKPKQISKKKESKKKTTNSKANEKFFNKIKEHLQETNSEIIDIIGFSKTDLILKIKENSEELILIAYNKKRVDEKDILNAYKKASEIGFKYKIICLGEPAKKTQNLIDAIKKLSKIEKMEERNP